MAQTRTVNWLILGFVNLMWAAQYPAYRIGTAYLGAAALNFWTLLFAILILSPFMISRPTAHHSGDFLSRQRVIRQFMLLGVLGIIPPSVFLAWGIEHSSASTAAIITMSTPVNMALMGVILLGERITKLRLVSLGLAISGTVLVSKIEWGGALFDPRFLAGSLVVFAGCVGAGFYHAYSKKLLASLGGVEVLIYSYLVGCGACALLSLIWGAQPFYEVTRLPPAAWAAVLVLGALPWGFGMVLWMRVLKLLDVSQISVSVYLHSLFGVLLSAVTLHERLKVPQIGGALLVFMATFLSLHGQTRPTAPRGLR